MDSAVLLSKKSSEDIEKFIPTLSEYYNTLDPHVKQRYLDKISVIGIDPATLHGAKLDPECLPPIESVDLVSYLVLETSFYTKEQFKNSKSLEAYNQMVSGFVTSVQGLQISDKYVVIGKVRHSQRMNDPPLPVWIICASNGTILSAHCMGCKAGLGESCSHVASVLYYVESWTKIHGKLACTQVKCTWLLPSYVNEVPYAPISEIVFNSASKLKQDLDEAIDSNASAAANNNCKPREIKQNTTVQPVHVPGISPTDEEIGDLMEELSKCKVAPVCLSLVHPYYEQFVLKSRGIQTVTDLYSTENIKLSYPELLKKCNEIDLNITTEEIEIIEKETREQSKGKSFFKHRAGRIGASVSGAVAHTNPAQPSQSLIKSICYPQLFNTSTKATDHGIKHEDNAITAYEMAIEDLHTNVRVTRCGVIVNEQHPFMHATPDFLVSCDCCGDGCGEVKCPISIKGCNFSEYTTKKSACLENKNGKYTLKRQHNYYYQVQQQLHTTKRQYCDFVVYCCDAAGDIEIVIDRIFPDHAHWDSVLPKIRVFWRSCILPEILGRWYTRKCHLDKSQLLSVGDGVCYCRQKKPGEETVNCSYNECPIKVFHCSCLAVKKKDVPKTWYCPTCCTLTNNKRGKSKAKALNAAACALSTICVCKKKATQTDRLLECKETNCPHGKFFHLNCLNYKRRPNNSVNWKCSNCKIDATNAKPLQQSPVDCKPELVSHPSSPKQKPATPVVKTIPRIPSPISTPSSIVDSDSDSDSVEFIKETHVKGNAKGALSTLTSIDYNLILSPTGWLNCDIIQQAHVCLQKVNPLIDGFQRPTLGVCRSFDIMTSEFVQILHTGSSHWVCVSTIDCTPGTIKLYDSLYSDIIEDEIKAQVESLLADSNVAIEIVPVQQQLNGHDCGVFAVAFATCLVYGFAPDNINFDHRRIRQHLHDCLKNSQVSPFPTI